MTASVLGIDPTSSARRPSRISSARRGADRGFILARKAGDGVMAECQDCRFWERRTADSTTFGWCRQLSDAKIDIGVALIRGEWDGTGEKVFTSEDFGCVQFEAKG